MTLCFRKVFQVQKFTKSMALLFVGDNGTRVQQIQTCGGDGYGFPHGRCQQLCCGERGGHRVHCIQTRQVGGVFVQSSAQFASVQNLEKKDFNYKL